MSLELGERIRQAREDQGWSQSDLGFKLGFSKGAVQSWESGRSEPNTDTLRRIAEVTNKPILFFFGFDIDDVKRTMQEDIRRDMDEFLGVTRIPIVGKVRAGLPHWTAEDVEGTVPLPREWVGREAFAMRVEGDSMVGVGIFPGDLVVIRKQPTAESGQVVLARVNEEETTLKFLVRLNGRYYLKAANPKYDLIPIADERAAIIGVYVGKFTMGLAAPPQVINPLAELPTTPEELYIRLSDVTKVPAEAIKAFVEAMQKQLKV